MTHDPDTLEYVAQVFEDVARAGGTHVDDDHASGPGELSPEACVLAARFVRRLAHDRPPITASEYEIGAAGFCQWGMHERERGDWPRVTTTAWLGDFELHVCDSCAARMREEAAGGMVRVERGR